jgi:hypothetical protein
MLTATVRPRSRRGLGDCGESALLARGGVGQVGLMTPADGRST